jgi:D-proline reductase (dithiol) PrdE
VGIGPSTKETSLHHFRDPLLDVLDSDQDIDLVGVLIVGTPQDNAEKMFVGNRAAAWAEAARVDGVLISVDGWGNSHVDYANTIEELGKRNIPVSGLSFQGVQGKFVITNPYMDTIVDFNKSEAGIETQVVGENTVNQLDVRKALAFLKLKMRR